MRCVTGLDAKVYGHVSTTPGALTLINWTAVQLCALADEIPAGRLVRLTAAYQRGRHCSVAVAEAVGRQLREAWGGRYGVEIKDHYFDQPVLPSSTPA
ncbi:hypothetical protein [Streptomyces sp. NPDC058664]|uniref:hypothetical protein n=1 Tax=unclassified Streptomyces TaxID=2593676 RepID=UPI003649EB88